jgi:hypothetical protein
MCVTPEAVLFRFPVGTWRGPETRSAERLRLPTLGKRRVWAGAFAECVVDWCDTRGGVEDAETGAVGADEAAPVGEGAAAGGGAWLDVGGGGDGEGDDGGGGAGAAVVTPIVGVVTGSVGTVTVGRVGRSIAPPGPARAAALTPASARTALATTRLSHPPNRTSVQRLSTPDRFGLRRVPVEEERR